MGVFDVLMLLVITNVSNSNTTVAIKTYQQRLHDYFIFIISNYLCLGCKYNLGDDASIRAKVDNSSKVRSYYL